MNIFLHFTTPFITPYHLLNKHGLRVCCMLLVYWMWLMLFMYSFIIIVVVIISIKLFYVSFLSFDPLYPLIGKGQTMQFNSSDILS